MSPPERPASDGFDLHVAMADYLASHPQDKCALQTLRLLQTQSRCFENDCYDDGHVTGSAWILAPDRTHALLTLHRKLGIWIQVGGHSDGNPDTLEVALREAAEESGLAVRPLSTGIFDVEIHRFPAIGDAPPHLHYDVRFALIASDWSLAVSEESRQLAWMPLDRPDQFTHDPSVRRMRDRWLKSACTRHT